MFSRNCGGEWSRSGSHGDERGRLGRTWEEASSPDALCLTRGYEAAWQRAELAGSRLDPAEFLSRLRAGGEVPGARLAILRTDLSLRWDAGDRVSALWYLDRFPDLGEDCLVALVYEEFCLLEEDGQAPETSDFWLDTVLWPSHSAGCWTSIV